MKKGQLNRKFGWVVYFERVLLVVYLEFIIYIIYNIKEEKLGYLIFSRGIIKGVVLGYIYIREEIWC